MIKRPGRLLADRGLMSQFAFALDPAGNPTGPFFVCLAVSQTADPTGSWHRYAFLWNNTLLNDYPKFGVWPEYGPKRDVLALGRCAYE